jgi:hypothetical protein
MKKYNLKDHASAQCHIRIDDSGEINFISYYTRVITMAYKDGQRMIECTGTYSRTTAKQIGWFLKEYAPDLNYYDMKEIVGKGMVAC